VKRILFVDDEMNILDGIRRMLYTERKRWDMQFALGGEAALEAFKDGSFDVVIVDMRMPGMDGATLLGHIRKISPGTARVILSGYSEDSSARRAIPVAHRFLSKPSSADELKTTIDRLCTLQDVLSTPEIRKVVGSIGELPSLSSTYLELTEAVLNANISIGQVANIIGKDVAMSAKILQLVNSAFFGLAQNVLNMSSAVSYLGIDTIKNVALASEAFRILVPDPRIPPWVCAAMQQHAGQTAAIANALPTDHINHDLTVVAALLHDIGSLFLASAMPDQFCAAIALVESRKCRIFEAEEELLGTSHAEIGAYLLGLWGIPNPVVEAIAFHHQPSRIQQTVFDCTAAVYVADVLSHELEAHPNDVAGLEIEEPDRSCLARLGVLAKYSEFRVLALECYK